MSSDVVNPKTTVRGPTSNQGVEVSKSVSKWFKGDLGQIPILVTLLIVVIYFWAVTPRHVFLSPGNLSNLVNQTAYIMVIALGSVFVLLLGEIDLSLASIAYFAGAVMGQFSVRGGWFGGGWPAGLAILAGLLAGLLVGVINAFFVAFLRIPSFIVTLATSIFFAGAVTLFLAPNETIPVTNDSILTLAAGTLPFYLGVGLPLIALALYAVYVVQDRRARVNRGLVVPPVWQTYLNIIIAAIVVFVVDAVFISYRGVPISIAIVLGLIILSWIMMRFTTYGRHTYAVGGNAEASRRAGISVNAIRVSAFLLAALFSAIGGILLTSFTAAAVAAIDPTLLLSAIAAAVIGGVSLFGGRGSVWAVILGGLILGAIANGLAIVGGSQAVGELVEGAVLVFAVTADAVLRRRGGPSPR